MLDFGLAKQLQAGPTVPISGVIMWTPAYMSPEQARGQSRQVDGRTDVDGLGATLYALLTERPPHHDEDLMGLLQKVASEEPLAPRKLNPGIPREVETIVLKAMEKEAGRRYQSAQEFAEDLQRYLEGEPIRAKRASVVYRLRKKLAKHRWVAVAGAGELLATVFAWRSPPRSGITSGSSRSTRNSEAYANRGIEGVGGGAVELAVPPPRRRHPEARAGPARESGEGVLTSRSALQ